jgi:organic hydroperoxide reductase OsmC/OhrA
MKNHRYELTLEWTGNDGQGTSTYRSYRRDHMIAGEGKPAIPGSSDPAFRGDRTRYNPEDLLVASASACHMLSYLHLCAVNNIVVLDYRDHPIGAMEEHGTGGGHFVSVVLRPRIEITATSDPVKAADLHHEAHEKCFIANSVNFPITCQPEIVRKEN